VNEDPERDRATPAWKVEEEEEEEEEKEEEEEIEEESLLDANAVNRGRGFIIVLLLFIPCLARE